jgi:4-aminobutyrate aminotransferase
MSKKSVKKPSSPVRRIGPKSREIIKRDKNIISPSYTRSFDFVFKRGKGCYIWDADGNKYLDFSSSVCVAPVGYSNPEVIEAVEKQIKKSLHWYFADFYAELPVKFAEYIVGLMPEGLNTVFFSNSGTESVEAAYKLTRWHTNRRVCIAFENAFHGRTMGSLSLTKSKPVHKERFAPFLPVKHIPYPYFYRSGFGTEEECSEACLYILENVVKELKDFVAALFFEPIQGEGGYVVPPKNFFKEVEKICRANDILLVADEVQSGCFRTGPFLCSENYGVKPDVVCLAKGIGGGIPMGVTVSRRELNDWPAGSHSNTFGGNLTACAAGLATLKYIKKNKLGENAVKVGGHILKRLEELKERFGILGDVRGMGLMIGMEFVKKDRKPAVWERDKILVKCRDKGLLLLAAGNSVIRMCPPLTITKRQADTGVDILESVLKRV